jgi:hypothetical protein
MTSQPADHAVVYYIKLKGILSPALIEWFGNLHIYSQENGETVFAGSFVDQSALRGVLEQLWNLNLTVLSVRRTPPQAQSPDTPESV